MSVRRILVVDDDPLSREFMTEAVQSLGYLALAAPNGNEALERIADGSYGACSDCGLEIGFERLKVEPGALRCIECQRVYEKTFAHPDRPRL